MKSRPFLWLVRRELWEHPAIVIGPLVAAGLFLAGALVRMSSARIDGVRFSFDVVGSLPFFAQPDNFVTLLVTLVGAMVAFFYGLDALHAERVDRSILFWKSLPVSDRRTVWAKAATLVVVMPLVVFAAVIVVIVAMRVFAWMLGGGAGFENAAPLLPTVANVAYGLFVLALWYAPVHAWLLLVSAAARRAVFLWALLPPLLLMLAERMAFGTAWVGWVLKTRLLSVGAAAFVARDDGGIAANPLGLLTSPGLWIGLIVAVAFLEAAVAIRRRQGPL